MDKLSVPIAIVIAGGLIGGALYYSNLKVSQIPAVNTTQPSGDTTITMRPVSADDHILGNPSAQVLMVEYSDTECPFCKAFQPTLQRIMDEYGKDGKVAWVYRHFPIAELHSKAPKEAEALECANELGGADAFWKYENLIYATTNSNNSLDAGQLPIMAGKIGLDVGKFNSCLSSGKYAAKVQADYEDAIKAGGRGTPNTILVSKDGTKVDIMGNQPYEVVKADIDALLQK